LSEQRPDYDSAPIQKKPVILSAAKNL